MMSLAVFAGMAVVLFAMAFVSKRRFGILGLALTAGVAVSSIWDYDAGLMVAGTGLIRSGPIADAVVPSVIILLPAFVLFFTGYKYKSILGRTIGSALFALLAMAFLITPVGMVLPIDGPGAQVYNWLFSNKELLISFGVICAVLDLFLRRSASGAVEKDGRRR